WLAEAPLVGRLKAAFAAHGVAPERLSLAGWIEPTESHLAAYGAVDIALDPFPYNGTTTTLEALWMGVPVVTLAGARHSGRVGASLLTHAGLAELVADSPAAYIAIATALAGDLEKLAEYRQSLRELLGRSALMDAPGFARDLEAAYRRMWRAWCG
ncbi:MAG: tetratricopeptide repeat protein, partial [Novosphingobium sp.]